MMDEENKCECGKKMHNWQKFCWRCIEKNEVAQIWEHSKEKGEVTNEDYIICPYCGDHYGEDDMYESTTITCEKCDKKFEVEIEYSPSYSTYQV